jgi:hypothetical protein
VRSLVEVAVLFERPQGGADLPVCLPPGSPLLLFQPASSGERELFLGVGVDRLGLTWERENRRRGVAGEWPLRSILGSSPIP